MCPPSVSVLSICTLMTGPTILHFFVHDFFVFGLQTESLSLICRRNENAKILAKELLAELQGSSLDV
jgi:hypothetical protein